MTRLTRRGLLHSGAGAAAGAMLAFGPSAHAADELRFPPEPGARLRLLRWKAFVAGDEAAWLANTARFTELTGVPVTVESIPWETVGAEVARTAGAGSGPDIIIGFFDEPHRHPEALADLTVLSSYLGEKYGGWYPVAEHYGSFGRAWIALPLGATGTSMVYRRSQVEAAGFAEFPKDTAGFLRLCQALARNGARPGLALGHAVGDANTWTHWLLWAFGGKLVDPEGHVVIDSRQTRDALGYAKELYATFVPGTTDWLDSSNNEAFLAGELSLTSNGISIYHSARAAADPAVRAIAEDLGQAPMPIGPVGTSTELFLFSQAMVFNHTPYPGAAQEYLRFMWEREQYEPWQAAAAGYVTQPLRAYEDNAVWRQDPNYSAYKDCTERMLWNGYAGKLGAASAAALAGWVVVDMVREAATGAASVDDAITRAERRAVQLYRFYPR
jgi:multiple sugar transport system substrate-binding protein